jgi:hypothetical protein
MCLQLLQKLSLSELPVSVHGAADIDRLRVLHAAGLAVAQFGTLRALVSEVTDQGRQALQEGPPMLAADMARHLIAQARARLLHVPA